MTPAVVMLDESDYYGYHSLTSAAAPPPGEVDDYRNRSCLVKTKQETRVDRDEYPEAKLTGNGDQRLRVPTSLHPAKTTREREPESPFGRVWGTDRPR